MLFIKSGNFQKEKKIKLAIEEITGGKSESHQDFYYDKDKNFSEFKIIIKDGKGKELVKVQNLKDFEKVLLSVDKNIILKYAKRNEFYKWLRNLGEVELADKCISIEREVDEGEKLRKKMMDILEEYR